MKNTTRYKGDKAERIATAYLLKKGYQLIQSQFSCKCGEIDIIVKNHNTLVFVEVRSLTKTQPVHPFESISWHKQQKIIRTAKFFLVQNYWATKYNCRFDAIAIFGEQPKYKINWIPAAFTLDE